MWAQTHTQTDIWTHKHTFTHAHTHNIEHKQPEPQTFYSSSFTHKKLHNARPYPSPQLSRPSILLEFEPKAYRHTSEDIISQHIKAYWHKISYLDLSSYHQYTPTPRTSHTTATPPWLPLEEWQRLKCGPQPWRGWWRQRDRGTSAAAGAAWRSRRERHRCWSCDSCLPPAFRPARAGCESSGSRSPRWSHQLKQWYVQGYEDIYLHTRIFICQCTQEFVLVTTYMYVNLLQGFYLILDNTQLFFVFVYFCFRFILYIYIYINAHTHTHVST